jgi:hypothetical protein
LKIENLVTQLSPGILALPMTIASLREFTGSQETKVHVQADSDSWNSRNVKKT